MLPGSTLTPPDPGTFDADCEVTSISFSVDGRPAPLVTARRGDHVEVAFDVPDKCVNQMMFASFIAPEPSPTLDGSKLDRQALFSRATGAFGPGRHSMAIDVFGFPGSNVPDCDAVPRSTPSVSKLQDNHAVAAFKGGANQSGPYDSTCDGSPSGNGNGNGNAHGKPCAGCVGNADDKNPPGQQPGGNDHNAGYECDRNHGVGQGNPAHSRCQNFQIDFAYRPTHDDTKYRHGHGRALIAAVFCVRARQVCYTTDHTSSNAVLGS